MSRDDTYLLDILESARIANDYVSGKTWDEFQEDIQCQDAVLPGHLHRTAFGAVQVSRSSVKQHGTFLRKRKRSILKFPGEI